MLTVAIGVPHTAAAAAAMRVELAVGGGVEDLVAADRGQPGRIGAGGGAVSGDRHEVVLAFGKGGGV